jgi:hypothetical protein
MGLERLEPQVVSAEALAALCLEEGFALDSAEALAASLRRAASFLCPATPRALLASVSEALSGLPDLSASERKERLRTLLDSLIAHGDLIELPLDDIGGSRRHLYLGPPSFVRRDGDFLLIGIRPEGAPILDRERMHMIEDRGHAQMLRTEEIDEVEDLLLTEGLLALSQEQWLRAPRQKTAEELLDDYRARLSAAGPAGEIEGIEILDPESDVRYYRGRWRSSTRKDDGEILIRRPQTFGANLWSFAAVSGGVVEKLIDLPVEGALASAADEGWRLQAALDRIAAVPQIIRARQATDPLTGVLDLFAPLPSWAQRRLDLVAEPAPPSSGALFSYLVSEVDLDEEIRFLEKMMFVDCERSGGKANGG